MALTEKQEAFAVTYARTANAAEAYRSAYDVAEDARDSWIYVEALQLLEHPKIAPRIKELQAAAKERSEFTVVTALEEYEEARQLAKKELQASAMISATTGKAKILGLDRPKRVELTGKDGESLTPEASPEEIARRLAFLLAAGVEEQNDG